MGDGFEGRTGKDTSGRVTPCAHHDHMQYHKINYNLDRVLVIYTLTCSAHAISSTFQPLWTKGILQLYMIDQMYRKPPYSCIISNLKVSVNVSLDHNNIYIYIYIYIHVHYISVEYG